MDPHFYKGLRKRLREVFPSGSDTILYEIGVGYGEQVGNVTVGEGRSKLSTYRDVVEKGRYQGWGKFETPVIKMIVAGIKGEMVVKLEHSFFADAGGVTGRTECLIVAGLISGAARAILKKDLKRVEEMRSSKGDECCQFRLAPK